MYDTLVFIGRFQPLSEHHKQIIQKASADSKAVLVLVGSANSRISTRNPLSYDERKSALLKEFPGLFVRPLPDHTYNDTAWSNGVLQQIKSILPEYAKQQGVYAPGLNDLKIGIVGYRKDVTTTHLDMFPQFEKYEVDYIPQADATEVRKGFYETNSSIEVMLGLGVSRYIADQLLEKYRFEKQYKKDWGSGPFLTADSIVQVGSNILLIERSDGAIAMPGGFLDPGETFIQGAIRELREETRLRVPIPVLKGSLKSQRTYDDPNRSTRGRIITQAFHFQLSDTTFPEVRGDSDAKRAFWMSLDDMREQDFFEDHYHIIRHMLSI